MSDKTPAQVARDAYWADNEGMRQDWERAAQAVLDQFGIPEGHVAVPVEVLKTWAKRFEADGRASSEAAVRSYIPEPPDPDAELIEKMDYAYDASSDHRAGLRAALAVVREQEGQA